MPDTSADDKILGFEYQFYFFLSVLLDLNSGETAGFEVYEDVHKETDNEIIFYQLKHTIQKRADAKPKNLTTSDNDLWKTISLWVDKLKEVQNADAFLQDRKFIFVTNKSENENNRFINELDRYKEDSDLKSFIDFLKDFKQKLVDKYEERKKKEKKNVSPDPKIKYLENIITFDGYKLSKLLFNVNFELGLDNIILNAKEKMMIRKSIRETRVNSTFNELVGSLKEDFYNTVKAGNKLQFTGLDFYYQTLPIFQKAISDKLPFYKEIENYSQDKGVFDEVFAKQLRDIDIIEDDILDYEYCRVLAQNNLLDLLQNSEITEKDIEQLNENAIDTWKPIFEEVYIEDDESVSSAKKVFVKTKQCDLKICGQDIDFRKISNGQFINLSNEPLIGWKKNWEEYKKN